MDLTIFDEQFYLLKYPFLQNAIENGIITSGADHFQRFGLGSGLTEVSRYYDEDYYLEKNPDVALAVGAGGFISGLDHFIQVGYREGRTQISPSYNEEFYVGTNPDLIPFLQNGTFRNGLQHFLEAGQAEGRFTNNLYGLATVNPDSSSESMIRATAFTDISNGVYKTLLDYYLKSGQFEPSIRATFSGTSGNDVISAFGSVTSIYGIEITRQDTNASVRFSGGSSRSPIGHESNGTNEFDVFIGGSGIDTFIFSDVGASSFSTPIPGAPVSRSVSYRNLYDQGEGFATIQNFEPQKDRIRLTTPFDEYRVFPVNNDLHIETATGNLIAVIEDRANFDFQIEGSILSLRNTESNPLFDPEFYLLQYPFVQEGINNGTVASAYEHFEKFGQASGLTEISRYYEESFYLENNPDVISLINSGLFASGLDHFLKAGYQEGRTKISPSYNEEFYLARNTDIIPLIENGSFKNGLQHFLQTGNPVAIRTAISFEGTLLGDGNFGILNIGQPSSVHEAIRQGEFKTSFDHYLQVGQFDPNVTAKFAGTRGNDVVSGMGLGGSIISGVKVEYDANGGHYDNAGTNEFDILIGGPGPNTFLLSDVTSRIFSTAFRAAYPFYLGEGFATIRNFDPETDTIQLLNGRQLLRQIGIEVNESNQGDNLVDQNGNLIVDRNGNPLSSNNDLSGYNVFASQNDLHIEALNGDLLAIIEGSANLATDLSFFTFVSSQF